MEAVGDRGRVAPVGDPAHDLVAVVGNEEEEGLSQEVAPAMGQPTTEHVDEASHGRCEIVNRPGGNGSSAGREYPRRMAWRRPSKRRVRAIRDRLRELYGRPVNEPHGDPIAELVRTVLSQNTSDTKPRRCLRAPHEPIRNLGGGPRRPPVEVVDAIRPGGLANTKGPRIQEVLGELGEHPDLDWLADAPRGPAIEFLTSLPGVGRKTAACVLIFAFDRPEIPVDTHVYRVGGRLGLFPERVSLERGPRRDAAGGRPRGRLRAAHEPDPPRPRRSAARARGAASAAFVACARGGGGTGPKASAPCCR